MEQEERLDQDIIPAGHKKCRGCKKVLPLESFSKRAASPDGHTYKCKECERIIVRANYRKRKKEGRVKDYYEGKKEEIRDANKSYYWAHREHLLAKNKEYRQKHPEVHDASTRKRRALLKAQKGKPYTREAIIKRDSVYIDGKLVMICQICKKPIEEWSEMQIDHIIPVGQGGLDCYDNVRLAHRTCNIQRPLSGNDVKPKVVT